MRSVLSPQRASVLSIGPGSFRYERVEAEVDEGHGGEGAELLVAMGLTKVINQAIHLLLCHEARTGQSHAR